jgi:hypothetical protein
MKNTPLKFLFIVFIGALIAFFVGVGIDTFYPAPPNPSAMETRAVKPVPVAVDKTGAPTPEDIKLMNEEAARQQVLWDNYNKELRGYNRNVSIIALIAAVIIVVGALIFMIPLQFIVDGLLLGGVATLFYSIIRGFQAEDKYYRFIVVTAGLAVVIGAAYWRFIRNKEAEIGGK